jgi:2,4-dienoyl-CoA reductase-like NADH-dependent reductase (Old Yellow Enzyme family)
LATPSNKAGLAALLNECVTAHRQTFGTTDDLVVGLQLTHSGRFCRPNSKELEPRIAYHHPLLDEKFGIRPDDQSVVWTDDELELLIGTYVFAAGVAREVGFQFVDIKACHGYLVHEFLSARMRPGCFGGDFEGRTRLLMTIIRRVREAYPDLQVMVRLSAFCGSAHSIRCHTRRAAILASRCHMAICCRIGSASAFARTIRSNMISAKAASCCGG